MSRTLLLAAAISISLPALAQTTTTVISQPEQQSAPPLPPPSSTTVTTQSAPRDATAVETAPSGRSSVATIAVDSVYGGIAGALVGGGITLIDQGNYWQRDIMVGAGVGVLVGAAYGVYEVATSQPTVVRRAAADRDAAASSGRMQLAALSGRF